VQSIILRNKDTRHTIDAQRGVDAAATCSYLPQMRRPVITVPYAAAAVAFPFTPVALLCAWWVAWLYELPPVPSYVKLAIGMCLVPIFVLAVYACFATWFDAQARRERDPSFPDDLWQGLVSGNLTVGAFCYFSWVMRPPPQRSRRWRRRRPGFVTLAFIAALPLGVIAYLASIAASEFGFLQIVLPARTVAVACLFLSFGLHPLFVAWHYAGLLARWRIEETVLSLPPPSLVSPSRFYWRFVRHGLAPFRKL
jgi:hypothetical protein